MDSSALSQRRLENASSEVGKSYSEMPLQRVQVSYDHLRRYVELLRGTDKRGSFHGARKDGHTRQSI